MGMEFEEEMEDPYIRSVRATRHADGQDEEKDTGPALDARCRGDVTSAPVETRVADDVSVPTLRVSTFFGPTLIIDSACQASLARAGESAKLELSSSFALFEAPETQSLGVRRVSVGAPKTTKLDVTVSHFNVCTYAAIR